MQSVKLIGADVGNDALKVYLDEKNYEDKEKFEVMNVVAPGYERRILGNEKGHLSNLLDVNIEIDGKDIGRYFVGGIAFKDNRGDIIEKTKNDVKAKNIDTIILLITGAAYALYDPNNPVKTENIALGTLLPTEEYWNSNEDLVAKYAENFVSGKSYKVRFNSPALKKAEITLNIVDYDIQPESAAGHIVSVYDTKGAKRDGMENFNNEIHLGIFIGSITTEVSVFENGEFNPKGFFGVPHGTSEPLDKIIADLEIDMTRHQLDFYIRNNKPLIINRNGQTVDLTAKLEKSKSTWFEHFTKGLVNSINKKLSLNGINPTLVSRVNMGGGGAITTIDSFKKEFSIGNVHVVDDPRYANALGALVSIKQKRSESEVAAVEVLS